MNKQTSTALKQVGIPPHILGYDYLGEAIEIVLADRKQLHSVTKELYPNIAKKFNSTPSRVERAMRHAIKLSFDHLTADEIEEIFGNTYSYEKHQPTNSHFIAAMVELLDNGNEKGE